MPQNSITMPQNSTLMPQNFVPDHGKVWQANGKQHANGKRKMLTGRYAASQASILKQAKKGKC